ncbi:hypothetical protein SPONL_607 [uncultured Candidatus Thioglobus sp.]|nr:hypothetical protein SPONL_607 [uncultured Candidatus Thioglobus sp.]
MNFCFRIDFKKLVISRVLAGFFKIYYKVKSCFFMSILDY